MAYDPKKDPHNGSAASATTFGAKGATIDPSDEADLETYPKAIVVTAFGDLAIVAMKSGDGDVIAFEGCHVGFVPPYRVRRVLATGTTASVATIED